MMSGEVVGGEIGAVGGESASVCVRSVRNTMVEPPK